MLSVICNGRLVDGRTYNGEFLNIVIENDTIIEILEPDCKLPDNATTIDAKKNIVLPGLINAHTHGDTSLAKGLGDRWTLELLLNASPLTSESFRLQDKSLAARLSAVEMLLNGCTACYDLFSDFPIPELQSLEAVGEAYKKVGMRAVIAPLMADRTFWQAVPGMLDALPNHLSRKIDQISTAPGDTVIASVRHALKNWTHTDSIHLGLAPTIPYHCESTFFKSCRGLADEFGARIHSHLGESKMQAVVGQQLFGCSLTEYLDTLGIVSSDFTAAHCVWLNQQDIERLADRGAHVAHNPTSNLRLGTGVAKTREMIKAGINVGIGTDANTCSDGLNMFEAMRMAAYVSRIHQPDPDYWLSAKDVLLMATEGSAKALGLEDQIGRIAPKFKADLVFIDTRAIQYTPLNNARRQIIFQENGSGVKDVMVGGKLVVQDRKPVGIDYDDLRDKVSESIVRIRRISADQEAMVRSLEPVVSKFCVGLSSTALPIDRYIGL
ncbi:MAG: amidohydrolase [Acidiferrobacteraceae bacterium]|mgnify:CR=1 FL=1|nr:amidohydrolase [Acidiferrobacteraceae bacterium]